MRLPLLLTMPLFWLPLLFSLSSCGGAQDADLRLRKVVLYQNGIGYFEHSGKAQGDSLGMTLRRSELDDALKTLTIVGSTEGELSPRHGTVHTMTGDEADAKKGKPDAQRKVPLQVQVPGGGGQNLRVSFSVPTPIWKATYRVVFGSKRERRVVLQGWAAIQNTSGHDWNQVGLTLATGAPLSFGVNLTRPTYSSRPDLSSDERTPIALGAVRATSTQPGDRDGDGILDVNDLCPSAGEDFDRFEDEDGCPELDNDQDRILDQEDQCPEDPEAYNGVEDEDGCPDRGRVIVSSAALSVLDKIYFTNASAQIQAASNPILDAVAATLIGNAQILEIEIGGHAASNERDAFTLAEDRAVAVAAYLVKAGVASSRLRIRSYGDSVPVDTKSTAKAFAKNRRIEFLILRREEEPEIPDSMVRRKKQIAQEVKKEARQRKDARRRGEAGALVPTSKASGGMVHYQLPRAVSIAHGESALVPLINAEVEGEEIYLYRPDNNLPGSREHPSRAVRVVNTGKLALVPGPIAVFARDAFAGEGLLDSLNPSESAFIPFALDRSSTVEVKESEKERPVTIISISEASMTVVDEHEVTTEYGVRSGITPPKRIFVQHEGRVGYEAKPTPEAELDGKTILAPLRLVEGRRATLRLRESREDSRVLSLEHDSVQELRSYLAVAALPDAQAKELEKLLTLREGIQLGRESLDAKRSQRFDDRVRAYEIRMNLKALVADQGSLRSSLKRELAVSEKRGRRLASEMAVLSETLTKERIELKALLVHLKYKRQL